MDTRLDSPYLALRYGIGLMATLAGLDKFFNLLTDWGMYLSPTVATLLPVSPSAAMAVVGIVEVCVGLAILSAWTRYGALVASVWLLAVAGNLALAGFLDVAVRDVVLSIAAFTLVWTHSIEKIDWQEDWRITPQGLELVQARVKGSGAGMEPPPEARLR